MNIIIFGANGKVGRQLVEYTLADGHVVTAFIHNNHTLLDHPALTIARGDVYDKDQVYDAMKGHDAVLSALSSWGTKHKDVLAHAMSNIIPAMEQHKVSRIISLTGAEARANGDELSIVHRFAHVAISIVASKVLRDGERHIELLHASKLHWTVVRSPVMRATYGSAYELTTQRPAPWALIDRSAVANAMIDQLSSDAYIRQAVFIRKSK